MNAEEWARLEELKTKIKTTHTTLDEAEEFYALAEKASDADPNNYDLFRLTVLAGMIVVAISGVPLSARTTA